MLIGLGKMALALGQQWSFMHGPADYFGLMASILAVFAALTPGGKTCRRF